MADTVTRGSVVVLIEWWTMPDKYDRPTKSRINLTIPNSSGGTILTAEVTIRMPDGRQMIGNGGVPSADSILAASDRQEPEVLPKFLAEVVDHIVGPSLEEIVFRNPDGGHWVLYPDWDWTPPRGVLLTPNAAISRSHRRS